MSLINNMRYFLFQAEDGIRDYKVTGVQTCALPIYGRLELLEQAGLRCPIVTPAAEPRGVAEPVVVHRRVRHLAHARGRSEERRVGKEGRARGRRYKSIKKKAYEIDGTKRQKTDKGV